MQCRRCGKELGNSMRCTFCGYVNTEGNVREMTRTEKNFFNGVTIDADSTDGQGREEAFREQRKAQDTTRRTYINYGTSNIFSRLISSFIRALINGSRLAQIAAILIGVAFAALMFFIALPILFVLLAIGLALVVLAKISR
ncbi:MAG: hypothetical protein IKZ53_05600 [Selenomonadaceae bacterium]|nr:hypothetical protein [Selenomonadaceae bacterium]